MYCCFPEITTQIFIKFACTTIIKERPLRKKSESFNKREMSFAYDIGSEGE